MPTPSYKELAKHPIILASVGAVVVIAVGSIIFYVNATRVPDVRGITTAASTTTEIIGSGEVEPAQNPELTFLGSGRVVAVHVNVGQQVERGTILASLDTATLSAQRAQAQANTDAAEARLDQMLAGAKQTDIQPKQTAVDLAHTNLTNAYTNAVTAVQQSYDKAFSGMAQNTDTLFDQPNTPSPDLTFSTSNSQTSASVVATRIAARSALSQWQAESTTLTTTSDPAQVDSALASALDHLHVLRSYNDQILSALSSAIPSTAFSQVSITNAQTSVGAYRDSVNALITSVQAAQQQIASAKLGVQSAQDALGQIKAGATTDEIAGARAAVAAAQASVDGIDAQIRNDLVVAPFAGTVASVHIKTGDIVTANTPAISLNPESALQVAVYFSERDITNVHVGDVAKVTLDAYGSTRSFEAQVVSVDSAPSQVGTGPAATSGYKATIQCLKSDPSIKSGMTANAIISLTK